MKLTVRAIYNGTSKYFAVRATTPQGAIAKLPKRQVKGASAFIVLIPKTGNNPVIPVFVTRAGQ